MTDDERRINRAWRMIWLGIATLIVALSLLAGLAIGHHFAPVRPLHTPGQYDSRQHCWWHEYHTYIAGGGAGPVIWACDPNRNGQ